MAAAALSCAPCAFGAVSTSLLSFPINIQTLSVSIAPTVTFGNDSLPTTIFVTSTLSPTTTATTPPGAPPVTTITYTNVDQLTWSTLGAVLTFPTTYVDYVAFAGAAVTGTGCASTVAPSALSIPSSVPSASLIYPLDRTGALPAGLLGYLDSQPGFVGQLSGNRLETCAAVGVVPISGTVASVTLTQTSTVPQTTQVISTDIPPPTTYTTTKSSTQTSTIVTPASAAATGTVGVMISTYTGPTVYISGGQSTTVLQQSQVLGGTSSLSSSSTSGHSSAQSSVHSSMPTTSSVNYSSILSYLSSKSSAARASSSGIYTNITSTVTSTMGHTVSVPASRTASASLALYSGAATQPTPLSKSFWLNVAGSLGLIALL